MTIPHDLTADLPPPRDDEPASLRQDIVDELADHLECALHREQLASGGRESPDGGGPPDSSFRTARNNVLTRFGNPAAVARRLWLDAMKERLMAQKITILLASVATIAVVVLSGLMWQSLERSHEAQAALLQQHQQFSAGILQALESLRTGPPATTTGVDGWSPLTVKLVSETGKPVEGQVYVNGTQFGADKQDITLSRNAGPEGLCDFGMVPFGNYSMTITAIAAGEKHHVSFMIAPGRPSEHTVVCPTSPPPEVGMQFIFNAPEELHAEDLQYLVRLAVRPRQLSGNVWQWIEGQYVLLCVDSSGHVTNLASLGGTHQVDAGSGRFGMQALSLTTAPTLREYIYEIQSIQVFVPATGYDPNMSISLHVDQWIPETKFYKPDRQEVVLDPRAGTDNTYRINLPDDYWKGWFQLFRKIPYTRHATIPEDMQIVEVEVSIDPRSSGTVSLFFGESTGRRTFRSDNALGKSVDVLVTSSRSPNEDGQQDLVQTLIRSAELIAIPDGDTLRNTVFGRGFGQIRESRTAPIRVSILLTNEQAEAVVMAERKGTLTIRSTEDESATPNLNQEVFERLQELPDKDS